MVTFVRHGSILRRIWGDADSILLVFAGSAAEFALNRRLHIQRNLVRSELTVELDRRYRQSLGQWRYEILLRLQSILVPEQVRHLLDLEPGRWLTLPLMACQGLLVRVGLQPLIHRLVMPRAVRPQIRALDFAG